MPDRRNRRSRPQTGPVNRGFREGRFEVRGENVWDMTEELGVVDPQADPPYPKTGEPKYTYPDDDYGHNGYAPDYGHVNNYPQEGYSGGQYSASGYPEADVEQTAYINTSWNNSDFTGNSADNSGYLEPDYANGYAPGTYVGDGYPGSGQHGTGDLGHDYSGYDGYGDSDYFEPEFTGEYAQDYAPDEDPGYDYADSYPVGGESAVDSAERPNQEPVQGRDVGAAGGKHSAAARHSRSASGAHSRSVNRPRRSDRKRSAKSGGLNQRVAALSSSRVARGYRSFVEQFGWRAYAIPILAVITIWVLIDIATPAGNSPVPDNGASTTTNTAANVSDPDRGPDPAKETIPAIPATDLPAGGTFTMTGNGTYRSVGAAGAQSGEGKERTFTYVIEVEDGIDTSSYGGDDAFASLVDATLTNVKGWTHDSRFRFEHIQETEELKPDLRIQLTSVETTHTLCGNDIAMETSCFYADGGRVVINESRWVRGATPFQGDLGAYRQYLINHEVGHGIGYAEHVPCGGQGKLAPIMMQQTLSLSNSELALIDPNEVYEDDGFVCVSNPWPYPHV